MAKTTGLFRIIAGVGAAAVAVVLSRKAEIKNNKYKNYPQSSIIMKKSKFTNLDANKRKIH